MKKTPRTFLSLLCAGLLLAGCDTTRRTGERLEKAFVEIPDSVQTSVYWYWISGHVSEQGVVDDLHAMKKAGINRAFIGNIGLNELPSGPVTFDSPEWWKITHTALKTAAELGIEIGIFNGPGWSQSGGPWVKPSQAMRYLASSEVRVEGGRTVETALPLPAGATAENYEDVRIVAYPAPGGAALTAAGAVVSARGMENPARLLDGGVEGESRFSDRHAVVDIRSREPFTLRGLKIYASQQPIRNTARLEAKVGGVFRTLAEFEVDRSNRQANVGFDPDAPVVISVPETTASEFRLTFDNADTNTGLREVVLSSTPFVERYPEKIMAKMYQTPLPYWHEYMWRDQPVVDDPSLVVDPSKVVDLTDRFSDGMLRWEAPAGEWIVMRSGMIPTGTTNAPAEPAATGYEVDKMSRRHVEDHFEAYMGEIVRRIPAEDRRTWKVVVQDSYETGGQNFTDEFVGAFRERYGYDPVPFLPAYRGVVVGSEEMSDRFLWDMRRMVADMVAYEYVGGLRDISHKYGLHTWLECYGHWGFPGEFLQYGGQSDEIGGEFWSEGTLGDIENRAASSCGHIYGKTKISAESFTAAGNAFGRYPAMMKQRGDRFFAEGINNTLLHVWISQPYDREPGVDAWFGNEFNQKNTWYPHMDLFIGYLKRANFMLQQGLNIADAAYFIGEDAPKMTGVTDPALPKGYQFDYINGEVLLRDAFVRDGMLTLPHGTQYRILVLPKLETMRPELLAKIEKLIGDGAVVLGPAPSRSPSLENYPAADEEVKAGAARLWGRINPETKYARIGEGMLIDGLDMERALALIGCVPDCRTGADDPIVYNHRSVDGVEIYFVSNQSDETVEVTPEFRVKGMQPEAWNAIDGSVRTLPAFEMTATGCKVPLRLAGYESVFVVFRSAASEPAEGGVDANCPVAQPVVKIDTPWTLTFQAERRGPSRPVVLERLMDLSQSDDDSIRYYSGTVVYRNTFRLPALEAGTHAVLELGELSAMAKVKVNGEYAGGLWTPPYRLDVTPHVVAGDNELEIEVTTTWKNRLVGDSQLPEEQRGTWALVQTWDGNLQPSGLRGDVVIGTYNE